jgi:hypothetical protein
MVPSFSLTVAVAATFAGNASAYRAQILTG